MARVESVLSYSRPLKPGCVVSESSAAILTPFPTSSRDHYRHSSPFYDTLVREAVDAGVARVNRAILMRPRALHVCGLRMTQKLCD